MKKKNTLLENIALLIIFLMNFFERKDKNTRNYSISYKNYCSKWIITEDYGYVTRNCASFGTRHVKLHFFFSVGMFSRLI